MDSFNQRVSELGCFAFPILIRGKRGEAAPVGSGFIVKHQDRYFMISAAHVLEQLKSESLFYPTSHHGRQLINGKVCMTPWAGDREKDPFDLSVVALDEIDLPPYPAIGKQAVDINLLAVNSTQTPRIHSVIGFPASKTKFNPTNNNTVAQGFCYSNVSLEAEAYARYELDSKIHIAMHLAPKQTVAASGTHRNFPNPQGMSGAAIWVANHESELPLFTLAGVATKYRKKDRLLIGTSIALVLDMIRTLEA
jgi:hypothetical protein